MPRERKIHGRKVNKKKAVRKRNRAGRFKTNRNQERQF